MHKRDNYHQHCPVRSFSEKKHSSHIGQGEPAKTFSDRRSLKGISNDDRSLRRQACKRPYSNNEFSASSMDLPNVEKRPHHPKYDPMIEIRKARERFSYYCTKNDCVVDMLRNDDLNDDLKSYENKMKLRLSKMDGNKKLELEKRQLVLLRRQKDIDLGKVTEKYAEYVLKIPKPDRETHHPRTPNKFQIVSRRAWDGMIRKWRAHLHSFDKPDFKETWRSIPGDDFSSISDDYSLRTDYAPDHQTNISSSVVKKPKIIDINFNDSWCKSNVVNIDVANPVSNISPSRSLFEYQRPLTSPSSPRRELSGVPNSLDFNAISRMISLKKMPCQVPQHNDGST